MGFAMSHFKTWMSAMGYHGKQVAKAGARLGMGAGTAQLRYRGEKDPDLLERLAMAAVTAGLPAWSPERHRDLEACGKVTAALLDAFNSNSQS